MGQVTATICFVRGVEVSVEAEVGAEVGAEAMASIPTALIFPSQFLEQLQAL